VRGHSSEAFSTTVLPQASGVAMARTPRITGAFQGAIPTTTPAAWRTAMATHPGLSDGMTSPAIWVVMAAASRIMPAASVTLNLAQPSVAPTSSRMAAMKSSVIASSLSAACSSRARRAPGPVSAQAGKAAAAVSTTALASWTSAAGARVASSPVIGLRRSKVASPWADRARAPIGNGR
jgi:hypothetical protein